MNMKTLSDLIKISFYSIILFVITGTTNILWGQSGKPDLIITDVKAKYIKEKASYIAGQPIRAVDSPPILQFYITVKNIGHADFASPFYISYANDKQNIKTGRYSHAMLVSYGKDTIKVNDSLVFISGDVYSKYKKYYKFFIQTDGKPHYNDPLPLVEEENYENNTFEKEFSDIK